MKKSKIIFAVIAVILAIVCIFTATAGSGPESPTEPTETATQATTEQSPVLDGPAYQGTLPSELCGDPSETTDGESEGDHSFDNDYDFTQTIHVNDSVEINLIDMDPDAEIIRESYIGLSDPEYISYNDAPSLFSLEGKVYKNDRTISIDVQDRYSGDIYTFTFGYPTGQYNRFLYLNPKCVINGVPTEELGKYIQFNFNIGGNGAVANFAEGLEYYEGQIVNFNMNRHLAEYQIANYLDTQHPGAVWFTMVPLETPAEIHCRVFNNKGYLMGSIKIIVEKDEDGTYYFADIQSMDLWEDNSQYPMYTHSELEYIASLVQESFDNRKVVNLYARFQDIPITADRCTFVMRTAEEGYYYSTFVNIDPNGSDLTKDISSQADYTIAVTVNRDEYNFCGTVYFWVLEHPTSDSHGTYQIIGSDYKKFGHQEDLTSGRPEW